MVNAQQWLNRKYPLNRRNEITELDISNTIMNRNENLKGKLKLTGFNNLEKLDCSFQELTELDLTSCPNITEFNCSDNNLTSLDFLSVLNPEKLVCLNIEDNKFPPCDLSCFAKFINLKDLSFGSRPIWVMTWQSRDKEGKPDYNHFFGSLEPLQNLTKLKNLSIRQADIDSGLEYLPASLEELVFGSYQEDSVLEKKLGKARRDMFSSTYNTRTDSLKKWKEDNPELIKKAKKIMELETIFDNLSLVLTSSYAQNQTINQGLQILIFETEETIKELKKESQEYYESKIEIPPK